MYHCRSLGGVSIPLVFTLTVVIALVVTTLVLSQLVHATSASAPKTCLHSVTYVTTPGYIYVIVCNTGSLAGRVVVEIPEVDLVYRLGVLEPAQCSQVQIPVENITSHGLSRVTVISKIDCEQSVHINKVVVSVIA